MVNQREWVEMDTIVVLSLGGGLQSTALAILNTLAKAQARPPLPGSILSLADELRDTVGTADAVIFADTGCELPETYAHLARLREWMRGFGEDIVIVTRGNLYDDFLEKSLLPAVFGSGGKSRSGRRQCTSKYKVGPIRQWLRGQVGGRGNAVVWLGITLDEAHRIRPSGARWIVNEYPLVRLEMTRKDCVPVIRGVGLPIPPKSACFVCPLQNRMRWQVLASNYPDLFQKACLLEERAIQRRMAQGKEPLFLTNSGRPLRELFHPGQAMLVDWGFDAEAEECTGLCFL